jgi:hypothetical protein
MPHWQHRQRLLQELQALGVLGSSGKILLFADRPQVPAFMLTLSHCQGYWSHVRQQCMALLCRGDAARRHSFAGAWS